MDAPVEELGAPAEPLGPSGAPHLGAPFIPVSHKEWVPDHVDLCAMSSGS